MEHARYSKRVAAQKTGEITGITSIATVLGMWLAPKLGMEPVLVVAAVAAALGYLSDAVQFIIKRSMKNANEVAKP